MRKYLGKLTKPEPKKEGTKATEVARRPVVAKGETSKTKTADDQAAKVKPCYKFIVYCDCCSLLLRISCAPFKDFQRPQMHFDHNYSFEN
jgi:hypothetical protein